jgi:hypothetical protein
MNQETHGTRAFAATMDVSATVTEVRLDRLVSMLCRDSWINKEISYHDQDIESY